MFVGPSRGLSARGHGPPVIVESRSPRGLIVGWQLRVARHVLRCLCLPLCHPPLRMVSGEPNKS